jgi:hypothetical protein
MKNCPLRRVISLFLFVFLFFPLSRGLVNASLQFQFVSVNNERVEVNGDGKVYVNPGDAVRVSGYVEDGLDMAIFLEDKELEPIVSEDGRWYVLFSITDMEEGEYGILANSPEDEESLLLKLMVQEVREEVLQSSDSIWSDSLSVGNGWLMYGLIVIVIFVITVVVILFLSKKRLKKVKGK